MTPNKIIDFLDRIIKSNELTHPANKLIAWDGNTLSATNMNQFVEFSGLAVRAFESLHQGLYSPIDLKFYIKHLRDEKGIDPIEKNVDKFPKLEAEFPVENEIKIPVNRTIDDKLQTALKFTSNDTTRIVMNGVLLGRGGISATDGRILITFKHDIGIDECILPKELIKLLSKHRIHSLCLDSKKHWIKVECVGSGMVIYSRLIGGRFPQCSQVIPKEFTRVAHVDIDFDELDILPNVSGLSVTEQGLRFLAADRKKTLSFFCGESYTQLKKTVLHDNQYAFDVKYLKLLKGLMNVDRLPVVLLHPERTFSSNHHQGFYSDQSKDIILMSMFKK